MPHAEKVYALVDPRTGEAFYVGCTTRLRNRIIQHQRSVNQTRRYQALKRDKIAEINACGTTFKVVVLETFAPSNVRIHRYGPSEAMRAEHRWTCTLMRLGHPVLNRDWSLRKWGIVPAHTDAQTATAILSKAKFPKENMTPHYSKVPKPPCRDPRRDFYDDTDYDNKPNQAQER